MKGIYLELRPLDQPLKIPENQDQKVHVAPLERPAPLRPRRTHGSPRPADALAEGLHAALLDFRSAPQVGRNPETRKGTGTC